MDLVEYAKKELSLIKHDDEGMQSMVDRDALDIIQKFSDQNHSGFSAGYMLNILERLLRYLPLTPLTGEDDEWEEPSSFDGNQQNKRCFSVFKDKEGNAYNIEGKIFSDDNGETFFTSRDSKVPVTFPYWPPTHPEKVIRNQEADNESE